MCPATAQFCLPKRPSVHGASAPRPIWLGQPDCQVLKHPAGQKLGTVPAAMKFCCAIDRSSHPQATYQISAQSINWLKSYYYFSVTPMSPPSSPSPFLRFHWSTSRSKILILFLDIKALLNLWLCGLIGVKTRISEIPSQRVRWDTPKQLIVLVLFY